MSFDALQEKIRAKKNPTVAGLDPKPEQIPPHILKASYETYGETLQGAAEAVWTFNQGLIDALCDVVPAVKPQAAYYERLGWRGLEVMERTIAYAGKGPLCHRRHQAGGHRLHRPGLRRRLAGGNPGGGGVPPSV